MEWLWPLSVAAALVTVSGALYAIWKTLVGKFTNRVSWRRVRKMIERLETELKADTYVPAVLVGVGREGSIVASLLGVNYRYRPFVVIDREFNVEPGKEGAYVLAKPRVAAIRGKAVLLVDCEVNRGNTMKKCVALLKEMGAAEIRTIALASTGAFPELDYRGMKFTEQRRPIWPWVWSRALRSIKEEPWGERG